MSDRFEETLRRSLPEKTSDELDARILSAARKRIFARSPRGLYFVFATAASLLLAFGAWALFSNHDDGALDGAPIRFEAKGDGYFEVASGSSFDDSRLPATLRLRRGAVHVHALEEPLTVDLEGGHVRLANGDMRIEIGAAGDEKMSAKWKAAGFGGTLAIGALIAVIELTRGEATIDLGDVQKTVTAPSTTVVPIERTPEGGIRRAGNTSGDATASKPAAETMPIADATQTKPPLLDVWAEGIVVDSSTKAPIEGARLRRVIWSNEDRYRARSIVRPVGLGEAISGDLLLLEPRWCAGPNPAASAKDIDVAVTNKDGRFLLQDNPPSGDAVLVEKPGYATWAVPAYHRDALKVDGLVRIELDPVRRIHGKIVEADGRPLRGRPQDESLTIETMPDSEGRFWRAHPPISAGGIFDVEIGNTNALKVKVDIHGWQMKMQSVTITDKDTDIVIALEPRPFIAGRVIEPSGAPAVGALVRVDSEKRINLMRSRTHSRTVKTDDSGFFRADVEGAEIEINVRAEKFADKRITTQAIDTDSLVIKLEPLLVRSISGRISDGEGRPIPDADVFLHTVGTAVFESNATKTDAEGRYRFLDRRPGEYEVTLQRSSNIIVESSSNTIVKTEDKRTDVDITRKDVILVDKDLTGIDIVVPRGGTVEVTVTGQKDENDDWTISLVDPKRGGGGYDVLASRDTDKNGKVLFTSVPPGKYAVVVGFGSTLRLVKVKADETVKVEFGTEGAKVKARVMRGKAPLANSGVFAGRVSLAGVQASESRTDADGRFSVTLDSPGRTLVRLNDLELGRAVFLPAEAREDDSEQTLVWPENTIDVTIETTASTVGAIVVLKLTEVDGIPLTFAVPEAQLRVGARALNGEKTFRFEGVGEGVYEVSAQIDGKTLTGTVKVTEGAAKVTLKAE